MKHDPETSGMSAVWHECYCRWYDNHHAGNRRRAAAWGWIADRIVRWA